MIDTDRDRKTAETVRQLGQVLLGGAILDMPSQSGDPIGHAFEVGRAHAAQQFDAEAKAADTLAVQFRKCLVVDLGIDDGDPFCVFLAQPAD